MPHSTTISKMLLVILLIVIGYSVVVIFLDTALYQWDFQTYYHAARADALGLNPYDADLLLRQAGGQYHLRFVYPPLTLKFFALWAALPYETAYHLWLVFKLLLLAGLIVIWRRYFLPEIAPLPAVLLLFLGFSSALYVDLIAGNISLFEQFLLWLGFAFLMKRKIIGFCLLIVLASVFKLVPIAFLAVLLFIPAPGRWRYMAIALGVYIAYLALGYAVDPVDFKRFFVAATAIEEGGRFGNPSLFSLGRDLLRLVPAWSSTGAPVIVSHGLYLVAAIVILGATCRRLRELRPADTDEKLRLVLFVVCVAYALAVPRFKTYSFILLLPAAAFVLNRWARRPAFGFLLALLVLSTHPPLPVSLPYAPILTVLWWYFPLALAFLVWALLMHEVREMTAVGRLKRV